MKPAFFKGLGLAAVVIGLCLHLCDHIVLRKTMTENVARQFWEFQQIGNRHIVVEEWWPWLLVSAGVIFFSFSILLPKGKA